MHIPSEIHEMISAAIETSVEEGHTARSSIACSIAVLSRPRDRAFVEA